MNALHDLEKIPDWCDEHVDAVQKICENAFGHDPQSGHFSQLVSQLQEVRGDMTKLRDCLDAYRSRQPARGGANSRHDGSVANLVADILDQEKARDHFRVKNSGVRLSQGSTNGNHDCIEATIYDRCLNALRDLIRNAKPALGTRRSERGNIVIHSRELGGLPYRCITISNPLKDRLAPELRRLLYREPIPRGRLRYGAFLAAWLVRTIGGDVHLSGKSESKFRVTVEIPVNSES